MTEEMENKRIFELDDEALDAVAGGVGEVTTGQASAGQSDESGVVTGQSVPEEEPNELKKIKVPVRIIL